MSGYKGASETLLAKHARNPHKKLSRLRKGVKLIGEAAADAPKDIELRFLRFSVTHYLPGFLGYGKHMEKDKK